MRERVNTIIGKNPVILVAPHGADDTNTSIIATYAAKILNCYAVINNGFERADFVDETKDKADCNRVSHCKSDIVFEEFLKPILKFKNNILNSNKFLIYKNKNVVNIFYIHGCGDAIHKNAGTKVSIVVGYGLGTKKDSLTCELWRKNLFLKEYSKKLSEVSYESAKGIVLEGKGGGQYAGRDSDNLNQYFRKHDMDLRVKSMQLEFPFSCRKTKINSSETGHLLGMVIKDYINNDSVFDSDEDYV